MKKPLVSIVIATKTKKNIRKCLDSIFKQTYNKFKIIVVDNFSKDKTREISKKFTNLVYEKGPERSTQRNFGAQKAKGKYILFIDADMKLTPTVLMECVKKLRVIPKWDV